MSRYDNHDHCTGCLGQNAREWPTLDKRSVSNLPWTKGRWVTYLAQKVGEWPTLHKRSVSDLPLTKGRWVTYLAQKVGEWPTLHERSVNDLPWTEMSVSDLPWTKRSANDLPWTEMSVSDLPWTKRSMSDLPWTKGRWVTCFGQKVGEWPTLDKRSTSDLFMVTVCSSEPLSMERSSLLFMPEPVRWLTVIMAFRSWYKTLGIWFDSKVFLSIN